MQEIAYYNIVGQILMGMYNRVLSLLLKREGLAFSQYNIMENLPELEEVDPQIHIRRLHNEFEQLDAIVREKIPRLQL